MVNCKTLSRYSPAGGITAGSKVVRTMEPSGNGSGECPWRERSCARIQNAQNQNPAQKVARAQQEKAQNRCEGAF